MSSMGFLGAMAGLGQGMQHYSTLLGEKRKKDWEEQAQIAKDQRYQNLLKLQNDWTAKREEDRDLRGHTNRLSELEAGRTSAIKQAEDLRRLGNQWTVEDANNPNLIAAEEAKRKRDLDFEVRKTKATGTVDNELFQERVETQAAFAKSWSKKQRLEEWGEMETSGVLDGLDEESILKIKIATLYPDLAPHLKDKQAPAEVLSKFAGIFEKVYTESYDKYDSLSDQERMKIDSAAKTAKQNPREYFASSQALLVTSLASNSLGFGNFGKSVNNDKERKQTIKEVASGETTVQDLLDAGVAVDVVEKIAKEAGVPFEAPALTEAPTLKTPPNKVDNTRKIVDETRARLGLKPLNHGWPEIFKSFGDVDATR